MYCSNYSKVCGIVGGILANLYTSVNIMWTHVEQPIYILKFDLSHQNNKIIFLINFSYDYFLT